MEKISCEDFLMAKMAEMDGEKTEITAEQAALHLAECEGCRQELAQLQNTDRLLKRQARREQEADLWPAIEKRIEAKAAERKWIPFLVLGLFLFVYKLFEILPASDFGFALKIVPLVFVAALFAFLKENPFKINTELMLEK